MTAKGKGFTLIELLLVIAIMGILAAVTAPSLMRSIRGSRLSSASRDIISAGRYARSMAVMRQVEMALVINLEEGTVSVRAMPLDLFERVVEPKPVEKKEGAPESEPVVTNSFNEPEESNKVEHSSITAGAEELKRKFDYVTVASLNFSESRETLTKGTCQILYRSNGTCEPYDVELKDGSGDTLKIYVDPLSSARTEEPR